MHVWVVLGKPTEDHKGPQGTAALWDHAVAVLETRGSWAAVPNRPQPLVPLASLRVLRGSSFTMIGFHGK